MSLSPARRDAVDPDGQAAGQLELGTDGRVLATTADSGGRGASGRPGGRARAHGGVRGVALALGLRLRRSALDERDELGDQDRIVSAVVDPAAAEHPVLGSCRSGHFRRGAARCPGT